MHGISHACAGVLALAVLTGGGVAEAHASLLAEGAGSRGQAGAAAEYARFIRSISPAQGVVPASNPPADSARRARARPVARAERPVAVAMTTGEGQAGYVHYFLIESAAEGREVQIGIELADRRIAWSFPGVGVVVSPFMESGTIQANDKEYEVWHLYGIRPFPDDASMAALQRNLDERVRRWLDARTPYCENDGPGSKCMSCLGFVLRVLFPPRSGEYPDLPREFRHAVTGSKYSTHDLLLYLAGVLELPTREARMRRIARLGLPEQLRHDLEILVRVAAGSTPTAADGSGTKSGRAAPRGKL